MENFEENALLSMDVDELIGIINRGEYKTKFPNIRYFQQKNVYIFILNKGRETYKYIDKYIAFEKVIKVNLYKKGKEKKLISFNIRTNKELINYLN